MIFPPVVFFKEFPHFTSILKTVLYTLKISFILLNFSVRKNRSHPWAHAEPPGGRGSTFPLFRSPRLSRLWRRHNRAAPAWTASPARPGSSTPQEAAEVVRTGFRLGAQRPPPPGGPAQWRSAVGPTSVAYFHGRGDPYHLPSLSPLPTRFLPHASRPASILRATGHRGTLERQLWNQKFRIRPNMHAFQTLFAWEWMEEAKRGFALKVPRWTSKERWRRREPQAASTVARRIFALLLQDVSGLCISLSGIFPAAARQRGPRQFRRRRCSSLRV